MLVLLLRPVLFEERGGGANLESQCSSSSEKEAVEKIFEDTSVVGIAAGIASGSYRKV